MHAPNMFLYRYAWALSITVIYLAAETLVRLRQVSIKNFTLIVSFLLICFTSTFIFRDHYEFLTDVNFLLTLEFLIAYFILFVAMIRYKSSLKWINIVLLFFTFLELGLHSHYQVQGFLMNGIFLADQTMKKN